MSFRGTDFYHLDDLFSDEEKLVRDTVRDFVDTEYLPHIKEYWEEARFPVGMVPRLGELGLLGPTFPEEYGGSGAGYMI